MRAISKRVPAACPAVSKEPSAARQTAFFIFLVTIIYVILYRRFLFGSAVYLYSDIGSDSVASSYPILVMLSRLFREGDFSFYTLSSGLGADTTATFLQYVNPLKAFLLLFDRNTMPVGILIQLYLETLLSAWSAYRYLRLMTGHTAASMAGGLLFAYSSYAVLWSQNLSYGVCVAMFALTMLALETFLRSRTRVHFLALAGVLALYLFTNYFFCFMTAVFVIAYIPLRALFLREMFRTAAKQFLAVGLSALSALVLSATAVAAIAGSFLGSVRTGDASRSLTSLLSKGVDPRMLAASAARLFSENLLGIGDEYRGPDNYYEIAALSIGCLFFFAFFYLLALKKTRAKLLLVTALCLLSLALPILRYLLNVNWLVMRFSFWITLLMSLAAALFLRDVLTDFQPGALIFSVIGAGAACALLAGLLYLVREPLSLGFSTRTLLFFALFFALFAVCLLVVRKGLLPPAYRPLAFLLLIAAEIVIMHHDTLYLRLYLTKEQFADSAYSPATNEAVQALKAGDKDLYRIASTENPFYANEGLVDGFNGTTLYNNTNPAALRTLAAAYGTNEVSTPYFLSGYPEYYQFTALAGRYLIRTEAVGAPVTEPALFERIAAYPTKDPEKEKVVYRNKNALPFGYVFYNEIPEEAFLREDLVGRMEHLTKSWYRTGSAGDAASPGADRTGAGVSDEAGALAAPGLSERGGSDTVLDLTEAASFVDAHNLVMERTAGGIRFTATGDDPYVFVFLDKNGETTSRSNYLHMTVRAKNKNTLRNIALYYMEEETSVPTQEWVSTIFYNKYYPESLTLLPDGIAGFRFDIDENAESVTLTALELVACDDPLAHFQSLAATDIRNISFSHDLYEADVTAKGPGAVLAVPFLYGKGWSATVNGRAEEVMNINGGLTGIRIPEGTSHVALRYLVPHFSVALIINLAGLIAYLAALLYAPAARSIRRIQKRKRNPLP